MADKFTDAKVVENYVVQSDIEGFSYTMDYADRNPELTSLGTSPTGMLLVSLSGCHLMTAVSYLNMKKIEYTELRAHIEGDFLDQDGEWKLIATVTIETDAKLTDDQLAGIQRFIHRHCKVSSILSRGNDVSMTIKLI